MDVLLLIIDCLRADAITKEDTPNLYDLKSNNLSFDRCVTPANWSLPTHASLFTGSWPHEHGYFHREHQLERSPLVENFNRQDYATLGVSANIYASSSHGFATGFDHFYETRRPLNPRGLNPFANVRRLQEDREPSTQDYLQTFVDAATHDHPIKSIGNYARAIAMELERRYSYHRYLPFVRDGKYGFLTRASARNSRILLESFDRQAAEEEPLFAFANYMDVHYPYEPPQSHLEAVTNGRYDTQSITGLNPNIGSSKIFLNQFFADDIDDEAVSLVRAAYRGEVRSVDERIRKLLEALKERGERDDTIIIVTSDHGECLGEETLREERGMGHLPFLSEYLWRVPLIISHPEIDDVTVQERVSLKSLFDLLNGDLQTFVDQNGQTYDKYFQEETVFFELPANPYHESMFENFEHIPESYIEWEAKTHAVLGFDGPWRVLADSRDNVRAWKNMTEREPSDAPDTLVSACRNAVSQFPDIQSDVDTSLSEDVEQQLEDLGYL